jgi:hypothetical protein
MAIRGVCGGLTADLDDARLQVLVHQVDRGAPMKSLIFVAAMVLTGCVNAGVSQRNDVKSTTANDYNRDASECERQAALASAGSKAQAFANCMRARNRTPNRQ